MKLRQQIAKDLASRIPGCDVGLKFGHGALEVDGKTFAFTRSDESAALKLPVSRIAILLSDGEIQHLKMGERTMREWVVIPNIAAPENLSLLREAMAYVSSLLKTERKRSKATTTAKSSKNTTSKKAIKTKTSRIR